METIHNLQPEMNALQPASVSRAPLDPTGWSYFLLVWLFSLIFIGIEIFYQYFLKTNHVVVPAVIAGSAFAGGTLIAVSLFSSAVFKWYPRLARHWPFRRHVGDAGVIAISLHMGTVIFFLFGGDTAQIFFSWNPFANVIIFGVIAYTILFAMLATSTDWAMKKMGPKRWKFLHRFVYIAFPASIFHWTLTNPRIYTDLPGALLVLITFLAIFGQLFWFFKTIKARHYRNAGMYVGFLILIAVLITAYLALTYTP